MTKVFVAERIPELPHIPALFYFWGIIRYKNSLFDNIFSEENLEPYFEIVENPELADYILLPHYFSFLVQRRGYIKTIDDLSCRYGKTVLVFDPGDKIYSIPIQNFIVFHTWQYRFEKKQNEIIIPAISEDVGRGRDIIRHKNTSHKPSVGFCGWAAFPSVRVFFSAYWRKVVIFFQTILTGNKKLFVKNKGLLFRRAILKKLKRSNRVVSNFIIRKSFGSNKLTIKGSAEKARAEYIDNIANTDFSLAIRGDGNYSIRFYEILSMGRIPVLFDTECVFPMEKETDYDSIILRINISDIDKIDDKIFEFYDRLSDDDFIERQRRARDLFLNELYYPVFLKYLFADKQNIQSLLG